MTETEQGSDQGLVIAVIVAEETAVRNADPVAESDEGLGPGTDAGQGLASADALGRVTGADLVTEARTTGGVHAAREPVVEIETGTETGEVIEDGTGVRRVAVRRVAVAGVMKLIISLVTSRVKTDLSVSIISLHPLQCGSSVRTHGFCFADHNGTTSVDEEETKPADMNGNGEERHSDEGKTAGSDDGQPASDE